MPKYRVVIGSNPNNARDEWVLGLSIPQLFLGYLREGIGYDLSVVSSWRRRDELSNLEGCRSTPLTCTTSKRALKLTGVGLMFTLDGTTLLKEVVSALPLF